MRNLLITCIGYLKRPFSFYDIDDEVLTQGLQARGHDVSLCDWNDITQTLRATRRCDTSGRSFCRCRSIALKHCCSSKCRSAARRRAAGKVSMRSCKRSHKKAFLQ